MKALKIFGIFMLILIALVVISMFVIPQFYKDRIAKIVKTEINKQVEAEVDFGEFDLSLFRNFPDFSLGIHDVTVINQPSDTLMTSDGIFVTVGLFSVLKDETIRIKSISVEQPGLFLKVNEKGEVNWDIIKETDPSLAKESGDESGYSLVLNSVLINEADIYYRDVESGMDISLNDLNTSLKGRFDADRTDLRLKLNTDDFKVVYDGIAYMRHTTLGFDAVIDANLKDEIYNLKNNSLSLNGLQINFEGSVAFVNDNINLMLVYNAPDNSFRQLLSLIPEIYNDGYDKLLTSGQFNMDGHIKGVYAENEIPDFKLQMHADGAEISYPDMPANMDQINFDLLVENKGSDLDNTVIEVKNLTGNIGNDKLQLGLQLLHPISDPQIDLEASAEFTFNNLKSVFPQESLQDVTGAILADISLKGRLSSIEKQEYQNFRAMGSLVCDNIRYDVDENYSILLEHAQFNFSPEQIDVIGFTSNIGGYDLSADGKINNYLGYFLKDEMFKANLSLKSPLLDVNQLLAPWSSDQSESEAIEDGGSVVYIPENLDVTLALNVDSITYNELSFSSFKSTARIYDGKITFDQMGASFLGGLIKMDGYYEATANTKPHIDLDVQLLEMKVNKTYQNMSIFQTFAPVAEKAIGLFDANLQMNMELDRQMNPDWNTLLANGRFTSKNIKLEANEFFARLSDILKIDKLNMPSTGPIDLSFKIMDGKIFHKPFKVDINDIDMEVSGWTAIDRQIDYNMVIDIPVKALGNEVSSIVDHYAKEAGKLGFDLGDVQTIEPELQVSGTIDDPQITIVSLNKLSGGSVKDMVEDKVKDVVDDYLEEANMEAEKIIADAQKEADSILAAAQKQVDRVMQLANQTVSNIKSEAQNQADQLVKEAAKQGALAELAAKKAAEELLKGANLEADKALEEARQQSDKIMESARNQSEAIMQRALDKADMIRKR